MMAIFIVRNYIILSIKVISTCQAVTNNHNWMALTAVVIFVGSTFKTWNWFKQKKALLQSAKKKNRYNQLISPKQISRLDKCLAVVPGRPQFQTVTVPMQQQFSKAQMNRHTHFKAQDCHQREKERKRLGTTINQLVMATIHHWSIKRW